MLIDSVKLKKCLEKFRPSIIDNTDIDKGYALGIRTSITIVELVEKDTKKEAK